MPDKSFRTKRGQRDLGREYVSVRPQVCRCELLLDCGVALQGQQARHDRDRAAQSEWPGRPGKEAQRRDADALASSPGIPQRAGEVPEIPYGDVLWPRRCAQENGYDEG